jgi:hypothetical protein
MKRLGLIAWLAFPYAFAAGSSEKATSTKADAAPSSPAAGDRELASPKPPAPDKPAEVEISGTLKISEQPARLFVFVSRRPCNARVVSKDIIGSVRIDPFVSTNFFIEVFVPQGSTGNVCGAALDEKGKVTALGAHKENPLTFRGQGEVTFGNVIIPLKRLDKPFPGPEEFMR